MVKNIILVVWFVLYQFVKEAIAEETVPPNGKPVEITEAPYTVAIYVHEFYRCAGSYVKQQWVLTSGYCITGKRAKDIKVALGTKELNDVKKIGGVVQVIVHPDYTAVPLKNDVAVLEVENKFAIGKSIDVIPLSDKALDYKVTCSLVGWGAEANRTQEILNTNPILLRKVEMKPVEPKECKEAFEDQTKKFGEEIVDESINCAKGSLGDVCLGDLGAALVCAKMQVGITSVIIQECGAGGTSLYSNVFYFAKWIKKSIGDLPTSMSIRLISNNFIVCKMCILTFLLKQFNVFN